MKNIYLIAIITLMFLSLVVAQPSFVMVDGNEGFEVWATMHSTVSLNQPYQVDLHVSNLSTGFPITSGISCYGHLYNESGSHMATIYQTTVNEVYDYELEFDANNFTQRGEYVAKVGCNDSELGGGTEYFFYANNYGETLTQEENAMFYGGVFILVIFLTTSLIFLFKTENYIGKFAFYWVSHIMFILINFSVWQFNEGYTLAFTGVASVFKILFYFSMIASFPMIILSLAWIFYIHTVNEEMKKFMTRGMDEDEALKRAKEKRKW